MSCISDFCLNATQANLPLNLTHIKFFFIKTQPIILTLLTFLSLSETFIRSTNDAGQQRKNNLMNFYYKTFTNLMNLFTHIDSSFSRHLTRVTSQWVNLPSFSRHLTCATSQCVNLPSFSHHLTCATSQWVNLPSFSHHLTCVTSQWVNLCSNCQFWSPRPTPASDALSDTTLPIHSGLQPALCSASLQPHDSKPADTCGFSVTYHLLHTIIFIYN